MWWWWWAWVVFVIIILILPWSYGWSRRDWGPPYPTYYRRRYYDRRLAGTVPVEPDPAAGYPVDDRVAADDVRPYSGQGWTWLADLLWIGVLAAIGWAIYLWVT